MANFKRDWLFPHDLPERLAQGVAEPVDRQEAMNAFAECEAITEHLGGNIMITAHTEKIGARHIVVGYAFRWLPFAKGRDLEQDPEPELAEA